MAYEKPPTKITSDPFEGRKVFAGENGPIVAKDVDEFEKINDKITMGKDIEDMKNLLLTGTKTSENIAFAGTMTRELESGNPDKALDFCLSQSKNDSNHDYSATIKKLYKWLIKSGKGTALANEKVAQSFIERDPSFQNEDTIHKEIAALIKIGKLKEALLETGEHLLDMDKEIERFKKRNDPEDADQITFLMEQEHLFIMVRDTLLSQTL